jgi:hypothetical protein
MNPNNTVPQKPASSVPERRKPGALRVDIPAISELPDGQCEAALHVALDRIADAAETDPLQGLASLIDLMQRVNIELYKCFAPAAIQAAQNTAVVAQHALGTPQVPGLTSNVSKDQQRTITTLAELQESIVKMGVAAVKIRAEVERQRRGAHGRNKDSENSEED